ncbi:MAG TPA: hypothetical protein VG603_02310, partial [Chitinophagales bacterium]|nr:hypothetical protein [Chitinophagales bacterium]
MKADKTIIYDNHCPLCTAYTAVFVNAGVLTNDGRKSFATANTCILNTIDMQRARHEIPVIDNQTGQVLYGVDGLAEIAAGIFPSLKKLFTNHRAKAFIKPLYNFISYNRRIIAGSPPETETEIICAPDFNLKWRLALITSGMAYTAGCIYAFGSLMQISLPVLYAFVTAYFFLLVLADFLLNKAFVNKCDYIGHLATLGFVEGTLFVLTALLSKLT